MNNMQKDSFEDLYPNIAAWVMDGWVEIGRDDFSRSQVRALDIGGLIWIAQQTALPSSANQAHTLPVRRHHSPCAFLRTIAAFRVLTMGFTVLL